MGAGDIKLAAVDVLSVGAGFVLGAGALARYTDVHAQAGPATAVAVGVMCGVALAAAAHYLGLRLLRQPLAGPSSAALLTTLTITPAAAAAIGTAIAKTFPGPALTPLLGAMAAVTALGTPAATRGAVRRWCDPRRAGSVATRPDGTG